MKVRSTMRTKAHTPYLAIMSEKDGNLSVAKTEDKGKAIASTVTNNTKGGHLSVPKKITKMVRWGKCYVNQWMVLINWESTEQQHWAMQ